MPQYFSIDLYDIKLSRLCCNLKKNRNDLRKLVIKKLWKEKPGTGNKNKASRYKYFVEKLSSGSRIFITRPARLKLGFDFLIHVENQFFTRNRDYPSHENITKDLRKKKRREPKKYEKLKKAIDGVFRCHDPDDILKKYKRLKFNTGFEVDLILKVCKWFFIEQDIRYWNYSGRGMLKSGIDNI